MNKNVLKKWDKLFETYFKYSAISEKWRIGIQRLLADETFEEEKRASLEKYFEQMVQYDPNPDDEVFSRLEKIKNELGFPKPELSN